MWFDQMTAKSEGGGKCIEQNWLRNTVHEPVKVSAWKSGNSRLDKFNFDTFESKLTAKISTLYLSSKDASRLNAATVRIISTASETILPASSSASESVNAWPDQIFPWTIPVKAVRGKKNRTTNASW